jgi:hypothetical protein
LSVMATTTTTTTTTTTNTTNTTTTPGGLVSPLSSPRGREDEEVLLYALHPYSGPDATTLTFAKGDAIHVLSRLESGWWDGVHVASGARGWFPSNFVSSTPPAPQAAPAAADAATGGARTGLGLILTQVDAADATRAAEGAGDETNAPAATRLVGGGVE